VRWLSEDIRRHFVGDIKRSFEVVNAANM